MVEQSWGSPSHRCVSRIKIKKKKEDDAKSVQNDIIWTQRRNKKVKGPLQVKVLEVEVKHDLRSKERMHNLSH